MSEPAREIEKEPAALDGLDEVFEATVSEPSAQPVQTESTPSANPEQAGLTLSEAASVFGVSKHTVRRWIKEGRIEAYKVNGERGPEWRVYGDHPDQNVDVDLTAEGTFNAPGHSNVTEQPGPSTELLMEQMELIREMKNELEGLTYRNGYLQAQLEVKEEQLKLLPDFEAKREKAESALREKEELAEARSRELETTRTVCTSLEAENQRLQEELERYKKLESRSSWRKFSDWMLGKPE